jgi:nucleoside-diphosphate-sugar epimerase
MAGRFERSLVLERFMSYSRAVLVTGASGFIGSHLVTRLQALPVGKIWGMSRQPNVVLPAGVSRFPVASLHSERIFDSPDLLIDVVIHLAARVHIVDENTSDALKEFRRVNVDATLNIARQAAKAGIKRFVFLSSIKVNGDSTALSHSFTADQEAAPTDAYGISKKEAEQGLREIAAVSDMEVVIIRPVLVYGPKVKANFNSLLAAVHNGYPLPFKGVKNLRSLVALDNLVDFIFTCAHHPAAANQTFIVSDGQDVSTPELIRKIAQSFNKKPRLLWLPIPIMMGLAAVLGKSAALKRICGSLRVDIAKNYQLLGWRPVVSLDDALSETSQAYLESINSQVPDSRGHPPA